MEVQVEVPGPVQITIVKEIIECIVEVLITEVKVVENVDEFG